MRTFISRTYIMRAYTHASMHIYMHASIYIDHTQAQARPTRMTFSDLICFAARMDELHACIYSILHQMLVPSQRIGRSAGVILK